MAWPSPLRRGFVSPCSSVQNAVSPPLARALQMGRRQAMDGYLDRLLAVDLTTGAWGVQPLSAADVRDYVGGRGLAARYLYALSPPAVGALEPGNPALLMTGPLTGTGICSCDKYEWATKSPLTGTYLCSTCGGRLGVQLRSAGYDGLLLTGAAERPVYLAIGEDGPQLRDAAWLWGKSVSQTQAVLRECVGAHAAVGCLGPAGEPPRSVRFAAFFDGQRSAGRGGLGAVLGSRRLKAIAVGAGQTSCAAGTARGCHRLGRKEKQRVQSSRGGLN